MSRHPASKNKRSGSNQAVADGAPQRRRDRAASAIRRIGLCFTFFALSVTGDGTWAQTREPAALQPSPGTPGPEHELLHRLEGEWQVVSGQEVVGSATGRLRLGGRFLEIDLRPGRGPLGQAIYNFGFDRRHGVYTVVAFDDSGTYWVSARGEKQGDRIILRGSDEDPVMRSMGLDKEFVIALDVRSAQQAIIETLLVDTRTEERTLMPFLAFDLRRIDDAGVAATEPLAVPAAIKSFFGAGLGAPHEQAPPEIEQFGQLVGLWTVAVEMPRADGSWAESAPGLWAWKYTLDGFAVSDLWFQSAKRLPSYIASLGRDYLLTSNRVYTPAASKWQVSWMANSGGGPPGADLGTFVAELEGDSMVMRSPPGAGFGQQRVVFSEISDGSFRWQSQYSMDAGKTWRTAMRMTATRTQLEARSVAANP